MTRFVEEEKPRTEEEVEREAMAKWCEDEAKLEKRNEETMAWVAAHAL